MGREYNLNCFKEKRQELRKNQTKEEETLWNHLRARKLGHKFYRQYGIGEYIVDFYCPKLKLVIEIDGVQHHTEDGLEYDRIREEFMKTLGIKTVRFRNSEVKEDIDGVIGTLLSMVPSLPKDPK